MVLIFLFKIEAKLFAEIESLGVRVCVKTRYFRRMNKV